MSKLFGSSFKDMLMAEAMLEDEYRSTHDLECDNDPDTSTDNMNKDTTDEKKKVAVSSALKTRTVHDDKNNNNNNNNNNEENNQGAPIRTVDFQVPPPKRRRLGGGNYSAFDIVQALYRVMTTEERLEALDNAIATFDHDDRDRHNHEIAAGADIALVKALVFLEFKAGFRREPIQADMESITKEINMVLTALECVYRASSESVGESFKRVGTDLLHILVVLIDDEVKNRFQAICPTSSPETSSRHEQEKAGDDDNDANHSIGENGSFEDRKRPVTPPSPHQVSLVGATTHDRDIMLRKATKCIGHFARVGQATKPIAHFPGFLGSILNLINMRPYAIVPFEARLSCLWTIANLACNTENMTMMMCTPSLINSLVSISHRKPELGDSLETIMEVLRTKSITSRALLNLSWSPENKILMSENPALVECLSGLLLQRIAPYKSSKTMQEIMVHTRRNSIGALRNLAAAPRRLKIVLCGYRNGKLLDVLTDVALNETDQTTVDLSFAAIHNLAIHDTAEAIVERPALVLALKNVLLEDDDNNQNAPKNGRQSHASSTILVLERSITPDMPSFESLRELLDAINPENPSDEASDMMDSASVNATAV